MMKPTYTEESFGILRDDDLVLDCILVRPVEAADDDLVAIRAWVPRYPLTKASVITCARQEVDALGSQGNVAHLVFDLHGTGQSEGIASDHDFDADLRAVQLWAHERFDEISVGFLGRPHGPEKVDVRPIRPGVVMETYHYHAAGDANATTLLYLATFGAFSETDESSCLMLANAGYHVIAMDPLRYLLHASAQGRLTVPDVWQDAQTLCEQFAEPPLVVGLPVSAGLALFWAAGVERIRGVLALGLAQRAFRPSHIFANDNPHTFFLARHVHKIAPRPVVLVRQTAHPLGGSRDELDALHQTCDAPRRLEVVEQATDDLLLQLLDWLQNPLMEG